METEESKEQGSLDMGRQGNLWRHGEAREMRETEETEGSRESWID